MIWYNIDHYVSDDTNVTTTNIICFLFVSGLRYLISICKDMGHPSELYEERLFILEQKNTSNHNNDNRKRLKPVYNNQAYSNESNVDDGGSFPSKRQQTIEDDRICDTNIRNLRSELVHKENETFSKRNDNMQHNLEEEEEEEHFLDTDVYDLLS